jgi:isochorismate synthase
MTQIHDISYLNNCFNDALEQNTSIALWKLPHQDKIVLITNAQKPIKAKPIFNEIKTGFVIAPFINPQLKETLFIEAETFEELALNVLDENKTLNSTKTEHLNQLQIFEAPQQYFEKIVSDGIDLIKDKVLKKIVFSRAKSIEYPNNYNAITHFVKLCKSYHNAFVSLVYTSTSGCWIGATPEPLLNLTESGLLKTVALAGTQVYNPEICPKQAIWRQKEIEEQALVSRYIIECFKKVRVREYEDIGPRTIVAGNLMHLKTDFTVDTVAIDYPHLGTSMLELLHPTSAVCGMPKETATNNILEKELYNRQFFSGFIGPVNIHNNSDIFVNIRCMQLGEKKAVVYAGAGITEDSIPENEWNETALKMKTILIHIFD